MVQIVTTAGRQEEIVVQTSDVGQASKATQGEATATLPGSIQPPTIAPVSTHNTFVVLRGEPMDDELLKVACNMARSKKSRLVALFGVEVPRTRRLDEPLDPQTERDANRILEHALEKASSYEYDLEAEIVQCRNFAHSIIEEIAARGCKLLIIGMPFHTTATGTCPLDGVVGYVLEHATCRVWLIRGNKESAAAR